MTRARTTTAPWPHFRPAGECALSIEFAAEISPATNARVRALLAALDASSPVGLRDAVPSYRALLLLYDPIDLPYERLVNHVTQLLDAEVLPDAPAREVVLPVRYGDDFGPDLEDVAAHAHLTTAEVIALHSGTDYLVYFLGFAPGFPYLGGLDPRLNTPRLPRPRTTVPAGSVGIGGEQTGVYSLPTPGGWRLLGRCPVPLYAPASGEPFLLRAGDRLRFAAVDRPAYDAIAAAVAAGQYVPDIRETPGSDRP